MSICTRRLESHKKDSKENFFLRFTKSLEFALRYFNCFFFFLDEIITIGRFFHYALLHIDMRQLRDLKGLQLEHNKPSHSGLQ